jgi:uncharacterized protein (UPF0332 family)
VTPEAGLFFQKANRLLADAETMLGVKLDEAAGRTAYLAAFHAAQAFIVDRTGKVLKTHRGVHTEFTRLTKDDPSVDAELRLFLSRSYDLKAVADYEVGREAGVSSADAAAAVETAKRFVRHLQRLIAATEHRGTSDPASG